MQFFPRRAFMLKPSDDDDFELIKCYSILEVEDKCCVLSILKRMIEESILAGKIIRIEVKRRKVQEAPNQKHLPFVGASASLDWESD